jgi:quercetin dioxygenase-like cupin family protein
MITSSRYLSKQKQGANLFGTIERRIDMATSTPRSVPVFSELFYNDSDLPEETLAAVEGKKNNVPIKVKMMMSGENMIAIKAIRPKGHIDASHQHDDHESIATLVKGRMRVWIEDKEFIAEPGAIWRHPAGVPHQSECLEDCIQFEIKSPGRKTW